MGILLGAAAERKARAGRLPWQGAAFYTDGVVKAVEIACPRCGSTVSSAAVGDNYQCAHCQTRFVLVRATEGSQAVVVRAAAPGRGARVAVVVVGAVVVGAMLASWALRPQAAERAREGAGVPRAAERRAAAEGAALQRGASVDVPAVGAVEVAVAEAAPPPPPQAELRGTIQGTLSIGGHYWLTTYANVGATAIGRPSVGVSLFDAGGKRVGEEQGFAEVSVLEPGATVPVLVLASAPPAYARAEIAPVAPEAASYETPDVPVSVREMTVQAGGLGRSECVGTVVNESGGPVEFTKVLVIGRDAEGALVSYAYGYATTTALAAGAESGFKVSLGTWEVRPPVKYEALALARPAR